MERTSEKSSSGPPPALLPRIAAPCCHERIDAYRTLRWFALACALGSGLAPGCDEAGPPDAPPRPDPLPGIVLTDVTETSLDLLDVLATPGASWGSIDMYSGGLAFTDVDGDELPDLILARTGETDPSLQGTALLLGAGDGTFENVTAAVGLGYTGPAVGVAVADFDGDGRVDVFVPTERDGDRLFLQTGPLAFEEVGDAAGLRDEARRSRSVALLDADLDGWLDLYVTTWDGAGPNGHYGGQDSWQAPNFLYRNRGDGTFENVTDVADVACYGRSALGAAAADLDADGDPDLYVANDFFDDCLYENRGDGTFAEIALDAGVGPHAVNGMGVALGDVDADGDFEIYVTDDLRSDESIGNAFYWNLGGLRFVSAAIDVGLDGGASVEQSSGVYWGAGWRDFDNDGVLELHVAQQGTGPDYLFAWHAPDSRFVPVDATRFDADFDTRGSAYADFDRDGRVDLALLVRGGSPRLFHNDGGAGNGWIRVRALGPKGNRDGIGATVTVTACGRELVRLVAGGTGYLSTSEPILTVGIGVCEVAEAVEVVFPGGAMRRVENVPAGTEVAVRIAP